MIIGERLRRAFKRAGLTQKQVAERAGLHASTVSNIVSGKASPDFDTIERIIRANGLSFSELFDEPQIRLSAENTQLIQDFIAFLNNLIANDIAQRDIGSAAFQGSSALYISPAVTLLREVPTVRITADEVENLSNAPIPEDYYRLGARRAFGVVTDAMIGIGILQGSTIYVRPTSNLASADGEVVVCRLNGTLYVKLFDDRGKRRILLSENPRYPPLVIKAKDQLSLVGIVVRAPIMRGK